MQQLKHCPKCSESFELDAFNTEQGCCIFCESKDFTAGKKTPPEMRASSIATKLERIQDLRTSVTWAGLHRWLQNYGNDNLYIAACHEALHDGRQRWKQLGDKGKKLTREFLMFRSRNQGGLTAESCNGGIRVWSYGFSLDERQAVLAAAATCNEMITNACDLFDQTDDDCMALARLYFGQKVSLAAVKDKLDGLNGCFSSLQKKLILYRGNAEQARTEGNGRELGYESEGADKVLLGPLFLQMFRCVYLPDGFFAPRKGHELEVRYLQPLTILHEITHIFVDTIDCDNSYGRDACLLLAEKTPDKAIRNADSIAYFILDLLLINEKRAGYVKQILLPQYQGKF